MSEIQSVMRTRAGIVDSGPGAQPSGLNQRYCPGEHDGFYTSSFVSTELTAACPSCVSCGSCLCSLLST